MKNCPYSSTTNPFVKSQDPIQEGPSTRHVESPAYNPENNARDRAAKYKECIRKFLIHSAEDKTKP